jgi:DNA-binding beta-propeller fold protein YncE
MMRATVAAVVAWCLLVGASCSSTGGTHERSSSAPRQSVSGTDSQSQRPERPHHRHQSRLALVTAELRNELVVLTIPGGHVVRRIHVAADPKTVAAAPGGPVAVVSPGSGTVTLFSRGLRRIGVFRSFIAPQLAAFTPDGEYVLVTDATAGTITSIDLATMRVVGRVFVGDGAHHLAISPDGSRAWVALGETATAIVIVDCNDPRHMRVLRQLHPAVAAHDVVFNPDGRTVWVSSATAPYVSVLGAASGRLVARVASGRAPQHVLFASGHAYITSGYGSSIEVVDPHMHTVIRASRLPYGSFNLAAAGQRLVTTSVLTGAVSVLDAATLRRLRETTVASVARSVATLSR